ncbi:hypothetical protein GP486_002999 [Trichoglossum hirsutum]|uniref:Uncharacterized protein n=1 Tax=Trichoglossum hirsutum TaxID=265104 RepID=A0A9P8LDX2_9PEZI|nr:hypothetical protein GP486_002999 [Trichoglossum hirsutum]
MNAESDQSPLVYSAEPTSSTLHIKPQYYSRLTITGQASSGGTPSYQVSAGTESGYVKAEVLEASWAGRLLLIRYEWPPIRALCDWLKCGKGSDPPRETLRIAARYPYTRSFEADLAYTIVGGDHEITDVPHSVLEKSWVGRILLVKWSDSDWTAYMKYLCQDFLTCG